MKQFFHFLGCTLLLAVVGCEDKKVSLSVTNRLTNVELREVVWEGRYLAEDLLPGETGSFEATCYESDNNWPEKGPIEFRLTVNGKTVFVKTKEMIELDCGSELELEVNDSTEIETF